jgi:glycosyltransferase involved in cell wall biosynthesis
MRKEPFFTILTASLNNGATVRHTLASVKEQTFQDLEHIVIDGKSNDYTLNILKGFEGTYNLSWLSEPDRGISEALNKGLMKATGNYVLVIQADDRLLDSSVLERVHSLIKNKASDICSFPVIRDHPRAAKRIAKPIRILWWNRFKFIFHHQGCFVRRRVFQEIGGFREDLLINMDYDFFYRALLRGYRVRFGDSPVTLMGGEGIGSSPEFIVKRMREERLVQKLNERDPFWRSAQVAFRMCYDLYKALQRIVEM